MLDIQELRGNNVGSNKNAVKQFVKNQIDYAESNGSINEVVANAVLLKVGKTYAEGGFSDDNIYNIDADLLYIAAVGPFWFNCLSDLYKVSYNDTIDFDELKGLCARAIDLVLTIETYLSDAFRPYKEEDGHYDQFNRTFVQVRGFYDKISQLCASPNIGPRQVEMVMPKLLEISKDFYLQLDTDYFTLGAVLGGNPEASCEAVAHLRAVQEQYKTLFHVLSKDVTAFEVDEEACSALINVKCDTFGDGLSPECREKLEKVLNQEECPIDGRALIKLDAELKKEREAFVDLAYKNTDWAKVAPDCAELVDKLQDVLSNRQKVWGNK